MTLLDAYAVVAFLRAEPAAGEVADLLRGGGCSLTATGVAEVVDHLVRVARADEDELLADLAELGLLDAVEVDAGTGVRAGRLRARHHHRTQRAVSLADCVLAAVAEQRTDSLATADPHLLELCHEERISTTVLPQSDGSRWSPT